MNIKYKFHMLYMLKSNAYYVLAVPNFPISEFGLM